jgi:PAS domain S-box-containing protein
MHDCLITIHDKDFNIIRANKDAKKILGLPNIDVIKVKCYKYFHGKDCPPKICPVSKCLITGEPATVEFFEPHLKRCVEIKVFPRFDSDQQFIGLTHFVMDITEQRLTRQCC